MVNTVQLPLVDIEGGIKQLAAAGSICVFTLGFTKKNAEQFFSLISDNRIRRVIDTRIFPDTQLSGFAKKRDLPYFLRNLCDGAFYEHRPEFAPTESLLSDYRSKSLSWSEYEESYKRLLLSRNVRTAELKEDLSITLTAFLCSEHEDNRCHRRLLVEHLKAEWQEVYSRDLR